MSRNGNGVYTLPAGNPVVTGTTISSTWANTTLSDIATALTQSVAYDGQTTIQADIPMSSHKFTGLSQGMAATDSANLKQIQNSAYTYLLNVSGINTITADVSPTLTEYIEGQTFRFVASGTNNGPVTLNVSSLGAIAILKEGGNALIGAEIEDGALVTVTYNGSDFLLACQNTSTPTFEDVSANTIGCVNLIASVFSGNNVSIDGVTSINSGQIGGLRNRLINGGVAIDQRNSGGSQTFTAAGALAYCVDRWYGYCTGANVTGQRVAGSGSSRYAYQFTGAASVTKIGFAQRIEAANCYDMNNGDTMISVDMTNSLLTTCNYNVWYANTEDTFGTLASPTRTLISSGSFSIDAFSSRYFIPVTIPAAATTGIEIEFNVGAQTSGTWTIGDVQFVAGNASEVYFEQRPVGLEKMLCKRYYIKYNSNSLTPGLGDFLGGGVQTTTLAGYITVQFEERMRTQPSFESSGSGALFIFIGGLTANGTGVSIANSTVQYARLIWSIGSGVSIGSQNGVFAIVNISSYIAFSAEL